jgi:hypothetical protein
MRRRKRFTIIRIGLALAALAVMLPVAAQAKPAPKDPMQAHYQASAREIPIDPMQTYYQASAREIPAEGQRLEIPYLSHGQGVAEAELGLATSNSPDDRGYARTDQPVLVGDGGSTFDVNPFTVTGFGLALLLVAGGMGLAIRHSRKSRLSPA